MRRCPSASLSRIHSTSYQASGGRSASANAASMRSSSIAWYDVLWILESEAEGRLRMADLARKAVVSRSNVTRLTDRMEKAGLVARADCPVDGRGTVCELTAKGRALRAKMWPVYRKQIDSLFGKHLDASGAKALAATFESMIDSMRGNTA